jgi:hypothetical protein
MIKLTLHEATGAPSAAVHLNPAHIIVVQSANPKGTLVHCTRGAYHIAQSVDQVLTAIEKATQ